MIKSKKYFNKHMNKLVTILIIMCFCLTATAQKKDRNGVKRANPYSKANYKPYQGNDPEKLAEMQAKKIKSVLKLNTDQGDLVKQIFLESGKVMKAIKEKEYATDEDRTLAEERVKSSRNEAVIKLLTPAQAMKYEQIVGTMGEKQVATVEFKTRQKVQYLDKQVVLSESQKDLAYDIYHKYQSKINELQRKDIADAPQFGDEIKKLRVQQDEEIFKMLNPDQIEKIDDKKDSPLESSNSLYGKQFSNKLTKMLNLAPQQNKVISNISSRSLKKVSELKMEGLSEKKTKKAAKKISKSYVKSIAKSLNPEQSKLLKEQKKDIRKEFLKIGLR